MFDGPKALQLSFHLFNYHPCRRNVARVWVNAITMHLMSVSY